MARLVERKGLSDLIEALAALERGRFELEIIGSGPDERNLKDLAARLGVSREVIFAGSVSRSEIPGRYRDADIFTLASWEEAFGNVFAEAMASGLPIVGSTVGGIPELVEHGKNGYLVPPREPGALAAAIRLLADNPDIRVRDRTTQPCPGRGQSLLGQGHHPLPLHLQRRASPGPVAGRPGRAAIEHLVIDRVGFWVARDVWPVLRAAQLPASARCAGARAAHPDAAHRLRDWRSIGSAWMRRVWVTTIS